MEMRKLRIKTHIFLWVVLLGMLVSESVMAQGKTAYTNQWIKKEQTYLKFEIKSNGLYKIPFSALPIEFDVKDPNKIQLFYRGEQMSIISTDNKEILFYGVSNDGSRDSLLYRPMSDRMNPYTSLFSDKAVYFLTVGNVNGLRAKQQTIDASEAVRSQVFHLADELKIYDTEYSLSTDQSVYPYTSNSFYEKGASKTGGWILRDTYSINKIQLRNVDRNSSISPKLELLIHGRSNNSRQIEIFVGKDSSSLRKVSSVDIMGFTAAKVRANINMSDIREDGHVFIAYKSLSAERLERYSIAYYKIQYPQYTDMGGNKSKIFTFQSTGKEVIGVNVNGVPASSAVYDVTNVTNPVVITRNLSNAFKYKSEGGNEKRLYISNEITTLTAAQLPKVSFTDINPKLYNYIIISTDPMKDGATAYANYRSSSEGGGHSVLLASIKDIYNQFNYGEVSPLGIRYFIEYMLSDGNRNKQLLILGKSISYFERRIADLEGDVPTVGFPGSDILLVSGLAGARPDEPAIPVGRVTVTTVEQVYDYLNKVKQYEHDSNGDQGWKKNVLHINGGHSVGEITGFKNDFEKFSNYVTNGTFGGKVTPFVKKGLIEVEKLDITPEVNEGVGMISYMGHGSQFITDVDFGYASAVEKGYRNTGKYPLLYFNGCGVGNIFNGRLNPNLNASNKMPLSLDWLLSKDKGGIAIIANSFESFAGPSTEYLESLYKNLFSDNDEEPLTIGQIQHKTVVDVLNKGINESRVRNIHQSVLQGDPALKLIRVEKPDYSLNASSAITVFANNNATNISQSDSLRLQVVLKNGGRYIAGQPVQVLVEALLNQKVVQSFSNSIPAYKFQDTLYIKLPNLGNKIDQLRAVIDPENKVLELSKLNNSSVLNIDWTIANSEMIYPLENFSDIYPPVLEVNFDDQFIESGQVVKANSHISLQVSDDRALEPDLNLIEFYIKNCTDESCDYVRIEDNLNIVKSTNHSFIVQYTPPSIEAGVYQLYVLVKDQAGNATSPYYLQFKVVDEEQANEDFASVTVSPNPTTSYAKFQIKSDLSQFNNVQIEIFNLNGVLISSKNLASSKGGSYQWYWDAQVTSGTYIYKVSFRKEMQEVKNLSGRVVIIK
jgi:hypothetical protein